MTWTNVLDASLAVDAPARSTDIKAIRDNITAQANGDSGAPKTQKAALNSDAVDRTKLDVPAQGTSFIQKWIQKPERGISGLLEEVCGLVDNNSAVHLVSAQVLATGAITVQAQLKTTNGAIPSNIRIYINGTSSTGIASTSTSYTVEAANVAVTKGDVITLEHYSASPGIGTISRREVRILTDTDTLSVV